VSDKERLEIRSWELDLAINEIVGKWVILWPFNPRYKLQKQLWTRLKELQTENYSR